MSKLTEQWIELFRAGKYDQGEFTTADLDEAIANYQPSNPEFEEAPSTIGHPTGEAPAWGWWGELKREGNVLLGKMKEAQPEFEEMVEKRLFPKRSVGLVKRDSGWNLHHVAFLGAQAPAVKGLKDCSFAGTGPVVKVEFEESDMAGSEETLVARMNAWFEEKFGKSPAAIAPVTFTEAQVKQFAAEAAAAAVAPVQAKLDATEAKFAERETRLATAETAGRSEAAIAKLKTAGKWVPAFDKMGLPLVFAELAKIRTTVEFGEGAEKKQVTQLDLLVNFLDGLKAIVPTADVYTGQSASGGAGARADRPNRGPVDENSVRFHEAVTAHMETAKVDYLTAATFVEKKFPNLTLPGSASAGQV